MKKSHQKNRSLEANLQAAKTAVHEMERYWKQWNAALDSEAKASAVAGYVAAYTSCKVFIENYLKHLYPHESKLPMKVAQDVRKLVSEIGVIEKVNGTTLSKAISDIEQISQDAA